MPIPFWEVNALLSKRVAQRELDVPAFLSAGARCKAVRHTLVSQHCPAVPGPGVENIRDRIGIQVCVIEQVVEVRANLQFVAFPRQLHLLADRRIRVPDPWRTELIPTGFELREKIDQRRGAGVVVLRGTVAEGAPNARTGPKAADGSCEGVCRAVVLLRHERSIRQVVERENVRRTGWSSCVAWQSAAGENRFTEVGAAVVALGAAASIVHRESSAGLRSEDAGDRPAAKQPAGKSLVILPERNVPDAREREAIADVVRGVGAIGSRIKWTPKPETEIAFKRRVAKK